MQSIGGAEDGGFPEQSRRKGEQLHEGRLLVLELELVVVVVVVEGSFLHWLTKYGHREVRETPERTNVVERGWRRMGVWE